MKQILTGTVELDTVETRELLSKLVTDYSGEDLVDQILMTCSGQLRGNRLTVDRQWNLEAGERPPVGASVRSYDNSQVGVVDDGFAETYADGMPGGEEGCDHVIIVLWDGVACAACTGRDVA